MPPEFDPYHKWLGIPPKDQPPHHYRLLGLELYESDSEVIDAAANRAMAYLLERVADRDSPQSKKLIGEIADARACLLDRRSKLTYDQQLSKRTKIMPRSTTEPMIPTTDYCPSCGSHLPPKQAKCGRCGFERHGDSRQFADTKIGLPAAPAPATTPGPPTKAAAHDSSPVVPIPANTGSSSPPARQTAASQATAIHSAARSTRLPQAQTQPAKTARVSPSDATIIQASAPQAAAPPSKPPLLPSGANLTPWVLAACGATSVIIIVLIFMIINARVETVPAPPAQAASGSPAGNLATLAIRVPEHQQKMLTFYVDDQKRQLPSNGEVQLSAGLRRIRLEGRGYQPFEREVRIPAGQRQTLQVSLQPYSREAQVIATIADERLKEISGLAQSLQYPNLLWCHNDSGDEPRVFLIDKKGKTQASQQLLGAKLMDWEDIATYSLNGKNYVMVADTGDNNENRKDCALYVFEEPKIDAFNRDLPLEKKIPLTYSDGPHNCEGLAVEHGTGRILLATKDEKGGPSIVFQLPPVMQASERGEIAKPLASLNLPTIYGMDLSADGKKLILLGKRAAYEYRRRSGEDWPAAFARHPLLLPLPKQEKGEAIAYDPYAEAVFLTSEGDVPPIFRLPVPVASP